MAQQAGFMLYIYNIRRTNMREKFCMRCGTPLNGAAQCPECGYAPQHGEPEKPGGPAPAGQSAPQAENTLECGPGRPSVPQPSAGPAAPEDAPAPQAPAPEAALAAQPAAPQAQQPAERPAAPGAAMPPAGAPAAAGPPFAGQGPAFGPAPGTAPPWGGPQPGPAHGGPGMPYTPPAAPGGQPPYGVPPYAAPGACGAQGGYAPPDAAWQPRPEPLTLGRTVGTLLAGAVPLIGWIVLLIWAFESGAEPNRRTLARGCLVVKAIGWALVVLLYALLFVFVFSMAGAML